MKKYWIMAYRTEDGDFGLCEEQKITLFHDKITCEHQCYIENEERKKRAVKNNFPLSFEDDNFFFPLPAFDKEE